MPNEQTASDQFWCPVSEAAAAPAYERAAAAMTSGEREALSRLAQAEWLSDAQIERLVELGVAEVAFGHALLTRLGRSVLGSSEDFEA